MLLNMKIPVSHHCPSSIPVTLTYNVHRCHIKRIGIPDNGADVHVVLPVFNRDMQIDPIFIKIALYSLDRPVAIFIFNITTIAILE
ncbi:hypothetical protein D3C72_2033290 [compost metagenome]